MELESPLIFLHASTKKAFTFSISLISFMLNGKSESGADMKFVQDRLGHGSIQITSDVYAHVSKKIDQSSMEKYELYMNKLYE
ncbi:hypothetical protein [Bacillus sp. V2I10]|uniref:hypothetical protein n=1 Tax=Bacillus sp. V2I10 TaxID=3042276 RepID=UPI0027D78B81|nr:hypothetical protein [Bacillus sp. V2I10]